MGEGTAGVDQRKPREIEREIDHLRTRLDRSLAELDRRRHELTDVRLQVRKHPAVFASAGGALLLAAGGIAYAVWRSRERVELPRKATTLVRVERPAWEKILAAVGITIAVSLTRKLINRAWKATTYTNRR